MMTEALNQDLLTFFKALSDANRLRIVGLLAQQPYSVEKLAEALGLGVSTTSHHLSRLAKAGLVSARTDGHFYIYSLETGALQSMAQNLLKTEQLPRLSGNVSEDAFESKVLESFTNSDGCILSFPSQEKKLLVLLRYALKAFEPGMRYSEKEVNQKLGKFNEDTAFLRRNLVEYGMMQREGGGGFYWRTEKENPIIK